MEALTIKTPADVLSFIGHPWASGPRKALCAPLWTPTILAWTFRVDLPKHDGGERAYARTVAGYLANDTNATSARGGCRLPANRGDSPGSVITALCLASHNRVKATRSSRVAAGDLDAAAR
ncbi:hypothetical protein [Arthrobacter bambusae]|uniref:Uncharacterized protein n=1 Tax=Arthrobacter bambusae TaxID=1338426 RepID=A0AAW8DG58_9MICC|nr:hypothetical protein [Arthrobacter bambusae]MDP9905548.1 hypothetical protein [Arthrobacter bambusae]MDQ0127370.1 hypothetical protein [Arthrobacter bambusae]MDQ0178712.1 hypothetical protein [Arthrobacter bambusae]